MIERLILRALRLERGERVLFSPVDLAMARGEATAVTGPNGVGKTSLLRAVAGFLAPLSGEIVFEGGAGPLPAAEARRSDCHFLGHQDGLKTNRTAREELLFQAAWMGAKAPIALAAADRLGLAPALDLEVRHLSAGQKRRLALARIVAAPRALWLLDEPLAPLDGVWRARFAEMMGSHLGAGGLILAAVHDPLPVPARQVALCR